MSEAFPERSEYPLSRHSASGSSHHIKFISIGRELDDAHVGTLGVNSSNRSGLGSGGMGRRMFGACMATLCMCLSVYCGFGLGVFSVLSEDGRNESRGTAA